MSECARIACPNEGTAHPVLLLSPVGHPETTPSEFMLGILVCDEHQEQTTSVDLIADDGWTQIVQVFTILGGVPPDRSNVGLAWRKPETVGDVFKRRDA